MVATVVTFLDNYINRYNEHARGWGEREATIDRQKPVECTTGFTGTLVVIPFIVISSALLLSIVDGTIASLLSHVISFSQVTPIICIIWYGGFLSRHTEISIA